MAWRIKLNLSTPEAQLVRASLERSMQVAADISPTPSDYEHTVLVIESLLRDIDAQLFVKGHAQ